MKLQIKGFAALVGVSVRTLHYYDEIGLLAPASVDAQSGYRYYDDASLARMQEIALPPRAGFSAERDRCASRFSELRQKHRRWRRRRRLLGS